ncbi:MAG: TolC family protein [Candidatus Marinimicrobia bacterium]|jgi:cobalt-zinc-cadmium efflux system outer membrane protein|nr:TolC family protein [Candidatus Neomarinimicrobiota bacterium]
MSLFKQLSGIIYLIIIFTLFLVAKDDYNNSSKAFISINSNSSIDEYISYALNNNPGLKARYHQWQASKKNIDLVNKLPNPKFNFGYFIRNVETAVGPQEYKIGISQKLPFYSKLKLNKIIQSYKSEIKKQLFYDYADEIAYNIKTLYYDIYFINRSLEITNQNIELIIQYNQVLKSRYISADKSQKDLLKSKQELARLKEEYSSLKRDKKSLSISFLNILNIQTLDSINTHDFIKPLIINSNIDSLITILFQNNRQLEIQSINTDIATLLVKKSKQNYIPDFSVGVDYILTGDKYKADGSEVDMSGKDPLLLMFSMEIPLQFKKIYAGINASKNNKISAEENINALQNRLVADLHNLVNKQENFRHKIDLYEKELIPYSNHILQIVKKEYSVGKSDFSQLLEEQRNLIKYQLDKEKAITEFYKINAKIKKLIGVK